MNSDPKEKKKSEEELRQERNDAIMKVTSKPNANTTIELEEAELPWYHK